MDELFEVINYIHNHFPKCVTMIYEVFNEIFGILMDDTQPLFDRLQEYKLVNIYETLAVFAIFSGDEFDQKSAFLFRLFDFDSSYTLEKDELVKTITVILNGICKVVEIKPPVENLTKMLAESCFQLMDQDQSGSIDFGEFKNWVESDFELQDFLLKYAGTNTYPNAKRRMQLLLDQYEQDFNKLSEGQSAIEIDLLTNYLIENLKDFEEDLVDKLIQIIIQNSKRNQLESVDNSQKMIIKRRDFLDVMKAWCAFSASDYNNSNFLYVKDTKLMFWVYEDEEPDGFRLKQEMSSIDEDKSGTVERIEWIQYLLGDSDGKANGQGFKSAMKRIFEKYQNYQGAIDIIKIKLIILDYFKNKMEKASNISQEIIKKNLEKISKDIIENLKQNDVTMVNWREFKFYVDEALDKHSEEMNQFQDIKQLKHDAAMKKVCLYCKGAPKIERSNHCKRCNRCVLALDHHCPIMGCCIGFYNRKFFILMLFWGVVTYFWVIIYSFYNFLYTQEIQVIKHNDHGKINNIMFYFGENKLLWLLPIGRPLGDGYTWPKRYELIYNDTQNQKIEMDLKLE